MSRKFDVVGIGLCVYDLAMELAPYPEVDSKVDAAAVWHGGGGPVPNALATLAAWGVSCTYVGRVGNDPWGRMLRDIFVQAGVDVTHLELDSQRTTPVATIWVEKHTGRRTAALGASHYSEPSQLPAGLVENAAAVHLDARHVKTCREAAGRARHSGVHVSLDIGSPRREGLELLPDVNHLVVAERFASFATAEARAQDMLKVLWRPEYEAAVITRGPHGSVGIDRSGHAVECGVFPVESVDTTGAGDVYHAGYLYGVLQGWSLKRRMQFAAAAAALATTRLGARGCLPGLQEVEALIRDVRPVPG